MRGADPPAILISGVSGGVAHALAAVLARAPTHPTLIVHDARRHRRVSLEDYEAAGGALTLGDVGRDAVDACVDTINRQCGRAVARASTREGEALDAEKIRATGARVAVRCGPGALSEACAMAEACKRTRDDEDGLGSGACAFAYARAKATTGCVFVDDGGAGSKTLYEALRPSATARLAETLSASSAGVDADAKARDELQAGLHWEFLRAHPETRPLLGIAGADARKGLPGNGDDDEAPETASMCGVVAAVVASKILSYLDASEAVAVARECDQWTHVEALALYKPDRPDSAPVPNASEYEVLPSGDDMDADDAQDGDEDCEGFDTHARLFGYDALAKLREMYVLVCGTDSLANDACVCALAAVGVGNVDVYGASGSKVFVRHDCEVDDLCDLDDLETYKYHVVVRTSACATADEVVAIAREAKSPVIEITSTSVGSCVVDVSLGTDSSFTRASFSGWMDAPTACVAAHIAAMEVVRIAQDRRRATTIVFDGKGIFTKARM